MTVTEPIPIARVGGIFGKKHQRPGMQLHARNREVAHKRADHKNIAVSKIDQTDDAVDHCVSQGDERVDETELQAIDDLLEKERRIGQ